MTTLAEARVRVQRAVSRSASPSLLDQCINDALMQFSTRAQWHWRERKQTITQWPATNRYALADSMVDVRAVKVGDRPLPQFHETADLSIPRNLSWYVSDGRYLSLAPEAAVAGLDRPVEVFFEVLYPVDQDAEDLGVPDHVVHIPLLLAEALVLERSDDPEMIQRAALRRRDYEQQVKRSAHLARRGSGPRRMQQRGWSDV